MAPALIGAFPMEGNTMDACKKIYFYTPRQMLAAWAGILALYAGFIAAIIIFA